MYTLAVIMARAGSRGLQDKCVLPLCGKPMIAYSIGHAQQSRLVDGIVLTTDSPRAAAVGRSAGVFVIDRPAELCSDTARVDQVVRHAVCEFESASGPAVDAVVILYGNIPLRSDTAIDRCIDLLEESGCDSVRTVAAVGKLHPDWMHRLDGDRLVQYRTNSIHRRQELEPLYYHDGGVIAVRRESLWRGEGSSDPHAFFGTDRRGVIQDEIDCADIDTLSDFYRAEALIRLKNESAPPAVGSACARRRPAFTAAVNHRE